MSKFIVRLDVTNSCNDNKRTHWGFFNDVPSRDEWVAEMKNEQHRWNFETPGAMSYRDYAFEFYTAEELLSMPVSELGKLTLKDIVEILKCTKTI